MTDQQPPPEPGRPHVQPGSAGADDTKTPKSALDDAKTSGIAAVSLAAVSFFVVPFVAIGAVVLGVFGAFNATRSKAGAGIILLNVAGIVLGITSRVLHQVFVA